MPYLDDIVGQISGVVAGVIGDSELGFDSDPLLDVWGSEAAFTTQEEPKGRPITLPSTRPSKVPGANVTPIQTVKGFDPERWMSMYENGQIPARALVRVGTEASGVPALLRPDAAAAWQAAKAAAARDGVTLTITDSYRTYDQQVAALAEKGPRLAADPGTSNHGWGMAVDIGEGEQREWMAKNGERFGFQVLSFEEWHFDYRGQGLSAFNSKLIGGISETPQDQLNRSRPPRLLPGPAPLTVPFPVPSMSGEEFGGIVAGLVNRRPQRTQTDQVISDSISMSSSRKELIAYARSKAKEFGWGPAEVKALIELWDRESGWNPAADNPSSSALGIPQALTSIREMPEGYATDPAVQILWGMNYIRGRYGTPSAALAGWDGANLNGPKGY